SAIDVAADDADPGVGVRIVDNWIDGVGRRRIVWIKGVLNETLANAPTVIFTPSRIRFGVYVHLFAICLPHLADKHVACLRLEAGPKRIAQAVGENLLFIRVRSKERIVGRDRITA